MDDLGSEGRDSSSRLWEACFAGERALAERLLNEGANIEYEDEDTGMAYFIYAHLRSRLQSGSC